jgi:hypothetical protein
MTRRALDLRAVRAENPIGADFPGAADGHQQSAVRERERMISITGPGFDR